MVAQRPSACQHGNQQHLTPAPFGPKYPIPAAWTEMLTSRKMLLRISSAHILMRGPYPLFPQQVEIRVPPHVKGVYCLAKTRGVQIGCEYAESFEVLRWIVT